MNQNIEILSYARGDTTAGGAVDAAARAYMKEHDEKSYSAAIKAVIGEASAAVADDSKEFKRRVRAYASEFNLSGAEAVRRVAKDDPRMRAVYELDPMAATEIAGISEPRPEAGITIKPWTPPIHETPPIYQVANILFNLPRDEFGFITLDQAAEALRPYPDVLQRASSDKMDAYARAEMSIMGLTGFVSEKYPVAFEGARRRYPSLAALYSGGRLTSQALRELLPQIQIAD